MGLRIREMMYHKLKLNKILSRITGKPEEQVSLCLRFSLITFFFHKQIIEVQK